MTHPVVGTAPLRVTPERQSVKQRLRRAGQTLAPKLTLMALGERRWVHEPEVEVVRRLGDRSATAIDVGANKGVYTYTMSRAFGRVLAFEPQPDLGAYLRRAVARNVTVVVAAVSAERGTLSFHRPLDARLNELGSLEPLPGLPSENIQVETCRLDDFAVDDLALLKIDVEGHEMSALSGAAATLGRHRPTVIIEAEERHRPGALAEVRAHLSAFGYRGYFWDANALHAVETFVPEVDQNVANLEASGAKKGRYISNFIFVSERRHDDVMERIGPAVR